MALRWMYTSENIDWKALSHLYKIAPLGDKKPENLKTVFSNSRYVCFVYDDALLVGAGRALADGVDCSYICDVAIHPDFQGLGIGKAIVSQLVEFSKDHTKIILYANHVAFQVGYESPSQFSREYARLFGLPPIRDVKRIRESFETA